MADLLLRNLIVYLVTELRDADISFGKTKLVKLLYLVDAAYYRSRRRQLTGLSWVFHHYGPYAFGIDAALKSLSFDIPQERADIGSGREAIVFRPPYRLQAQMKPEALYEAKPLVDRVLSEWGAADLNELLDFVYFDTEPMASARRGEPLDFSLIPPPTLRRSREEGYASGALSVAAQERLRQYLALERRAAPLDPPPRYDDVCWDAVARMDADELGGVSGVEVTLDAEARALIRAQQELAAPPGFEPGPTDPKSAVLPLHYGASSRLL